MGRGFNSKSWEIELSTEIQECQFWPSVEKKQEPKGMTRKCAIFFFFVYQRKISLWLHKHFKTKLGWYKTGDENEVSPARVFLEQKSKMTF